MPSDQPDGVAVKQYSAPNIYLYHGARLRPPNIQGTAVLILNSLLAITPYKMRNAESVSFRTLRALNIRAPCC